MSLFRSTRHYLLLGASLCTALVTFGGAGKAVAKNTSNARPTQVQKASKAPNGPPLSKDAGTHNAAVVDAAVDDASATRLEPAKGGHALADDSVEVAAPDESRPDAHTRREDPLQSMRPRRGAKPQVCVPIRFDHNHKPVREPAYPIVRCVIVDRSTNQNSERANASRHAVLAEVRGDAVDREEAGDPGPDVIRWLDHASIDYPFGLTSLQGMSEVARYVYYYLTDGRGKIATYFTRAGRYAAMIRKELRRQHAPKDLLWVVAVESNFDPLAGSLAGAAGLWQFMARTARSRDMRVDSVVDERLDPEISTKKGADYLLYQHDKFGTWPLALAAYNAGSGHVRSEIKTWGVTRMDAMKQSGAVYQSARSYAARIIAIALIDRNRERFGFDAIEPDKPAQWVAVHIDDSVRLSLVADAADVPVSEVLALNPALVGKAVPKTGWDVRLPKGTYEDFVHNYDRVAARYGKEHESVTLRFGETLAMVAARYGMPERVLRAVNGYTRRERVPYGTTLVIPRRQERLTSDAHSADSKGTLTVVVPPKSWDYPDRHHIFYQVHTRDSLQQIADYFGVSIYKLAAWNELNPRSKIWRGMVLQIFTHKELDPHQAVFLKAEECRVLQRGSEQWKAWQAQKERQERHHRRRYTVRKGDTVIGIAKKYGVHPRDIVRWNHLRDSAHIVIGQTLYVSR